MGPCCFLVSTLSCAKCYTGSQFFFTDLKAKTGSCTELPLATSVFRARNLFKTHHLKEHDESVLPKL